MVNGITVNTSVQVPQTNPASSRMDTEAGFSAIDESQLLKKQQAVESHAVESKPIAKQDIKEAVKNLNEYVQNFSRTLAFSVDENTGRTIIRVYDKETEELIREIPPEETLQLAAFVKQQLNPNDGLLIRNQHA